MKKCLLLCAFFFLISGVSFAGSLSTDNGRFVFGQISEFRQDQFMLDTETGRLWEVINIKKESGDERVLMQVWYFYGAEGGNFRHSLPSDIVEKK